MNEISCDENTSKLNIEVKLRGAADESPEESRHMISHDAVYLGCQQRLSNIETKLEENLTENKIIRSENERLRHGLYGAIILILVLLGRMVYIPTKLKEIVNTLAKGESLW